jgi:hypothetical protein
MAEQYADKRVLLVTVMWPGYDRCDEEPLRGIFHSGRMVLLLVKDLHAARRLAARVCAS